MQFTKSFLVTIEHTIKVELDVDKYNDEALRQFSEYWGLDTDDKNEIMKNIIEHIAYDFSKKGYLDKDLEGVVPNGQYCKTKDYSINVY